MLQLLASCAWLGLYSSLAPVEEPSSREPEAVAPADTSATASSEAEADARGENSLGASPDEEGASEPPVSPAELEPATLADDGDGSSEGGPSDSEVANDASGEEPPEPVEVESESAEPGNPGGGDEPSDPEGETDEQKKAKKKKKKKKTEWSLGGRVMAGWEGEVRRPPADAIDADEGFQHEFFLRQARVKFRLDYKKVFALRFSAELSDALRSPDFDRISYLRNGYARVRFHDAARLQVGHFKRPFSRLELRSPGKLPFRGRGLANDRIIEDRNYGDRSVGAMLWGKVRPARLRYYVGTFAPALRTEGVDVIGRVQANPWEWGSVGASGGYKRVVNGVGETVDVGSANADIRFKLAGFYFSADLVMGQDYLVPGEPWALGFVGYANYDIDLPKKLVLQPVVLVEWADTNIEVSQNDAIRALAGVNLLYRKRFRVMPQVEFIRPRGTVDNPWTNKDTYFLMLSLQL